MNEAAGAAWAGYVADRALLMLTLGWLGLRIIAWNRIGLRPESVYEPLTWMGKVFFPALPLPGLWYGLVGIAFAATIVCLYRPRLIISRVVLTASLLLVITPEFGFGHVQHVNHLFLLAHVYSTFKPHGKPRDAKQWEHQAAGYTWLLVGLLAIYTAAGWWKVVDMTIRDLIKPGVTWLEPEAMLATSVAAMRAVDLPMTVPHYVEAVSWIFPIGYVLLTIIFCASFLAAFRRPLLVIVVPTILIFHLLNAVTLYALFLSTIVVAAALMLPYDFMLPAIRRRAVPVQSREFRGSGMDARYDRRYEGGDVDTFLSFYAYREYLRDRSVVLAAPLYYPGIAWAGTRMLRLGKSAARDAA